MICAHPSIDSTAYTNRLWRVAASDSHDIKARIDAANELHGIAADRNNFDTVCASIDFDSLDLMIDSRQNTNTLLAIELRRLRKTLDTYSIAGIERIDMAYVSKTLTLTARQQIEVLNEITTALKPAKINLGLHDHKKKGVVEPVWHFQSVMVNDKLEHYAIIEFTSVQDCERMRVALSRIKIASARKVVTDKHNMAVRHVVCVKDEYLAKLTLEERDRVILAYIAAPILAALNRTGEIAKLSDSNKFNGKPQWRLNCDMRTRDKAMVYLEAARDYSFMSYSDGLRREGVEHQCINRGAHDGCLYISREQFARLNNEKIDAVTHLYVAQDGQPYCPSAASILPKKKHDLAAHGYNF